MKNYWETEDDSVQVNKEYNLTFCQFNITVTENKAALLSKEYTSESAIPDLDKTVMAIMIENVLDRDKTKGLFIAQQCSHGCDEKVDKAIHAVQTYAKFINVPIKTMLIPLGTHIYKYMAGESKIIIYCPPPFDEKISLICFQEFRKSFQKYYPSINECSIIMKVMKAYVGTDSKSCHGYILNLFAIAAAGNETSFFSQLTDDEAFQTFLPHFSNINNFCVKTFIYEIADNMSVKDLLKPTDTTRVADEEDFYICSKSYCNECESSIGKMGDYFPLPSRDGAESFHDGRKYTETSFLELAIRSVYHFSDHPKNLIPLIPDPQKLCQMINKYKTEMDDNKNKHADLLEIESRTKNLRHGMLLPTSIGEHLVLVVMNQDDVKVKKKKMKTANQSSIYDSAINSNITGKQMSETKNEAERDSHKMCMKYMISHMNPRRGYRLPYRKSFVSQSSKENSCGLTASLLMMYLMNDIGGNSDKTVREYHKDGPEKYHHTLASFFLKAILLFVEETHTHSTKDFDKETILLKDDDRFIKLAEYVDDKFTNDVTKHVDSIPENIQKCFSFLLDKNSVMNSVSKGKFSNYHPVSLP